MQYGLWACGFFILFIWYSTSLTNLISAFSALRGFALTGKNWPFALCVFVLGLVPAGTQLVCISSLPRKPF